MGFSTTEKNTRQTHPYIHFIHDCLHTGWSFSARSSPFWQKQPQQLEFIDFKTARCDCGCQVGASASPAVSLQTMPRMRPVSHPVKLNQQSRPWVGAYRQLDGGLAQQARTWAEAHSELQRIEVGPDEAEMDMMPNYTNIHTKVLYNMKWQLPHKEFPGKKGIKWLSLLSAVIIISRFYLSNSISINEGHIQNVVARQWHN